MNSIPIIHVRWIMSSESVQSLVWDCSQLKKFFFFSKKAIKQWYINMIFIPRSRLEVDDHNGFNFKITPGYPIYYTTFFNKIYYEDEIPDRFHDFRGLKTHTDLSSIFPRYII